MRLTSPKPLKLIACNVFLREACYCISQSPHPIDLEFTELGEHARSDGLRQIIQSRIDATEAGGKSYEAILILFGICGNAAIGLHARRTRLVMPRAHDCCTILLGSKAKFKEHFEAAPSTPFSSVGYMERGSYFLRTSDDGTPQVQTGSAYAELVKQYGEEDAKFIWESMHVEANPSGDEAGGSPPDKRAVFIDIPQTAHLGYADRFKEKAAAAGKEFVKLDGSLSLIHKLIFGQWDEEEFLVVEPGQKTAGVYDWDEVVKAAPQ